MNTFIFFAKEIKTKQVTITLINALITILKYQILNGGWSTVILDIAFCLLIIYLWVVSRYRTQIE